MNTRFRDIPSVDQIIGCGKCQKLAQVHGHDMVTSATRVLLNEIRQELRKKDDALIPSIDVIADLLETELTSAAHFSLKPVLNLTGTVYIQILVVQHCRIAPYRA